MYPRRLIVADALQMGIPSACGLHRRSVYRAECVAGLAAPPTATPPFVQTVLGARRKNRLLRSAELTGGDTPVVGARSLIEDCVDTVTGLRRAGFFRMLWSRLLFVARSGPVRTFFAAAAWIRLAFAEVREISRGRWIRSWCASESGAFERSRIFAAG